MNVENRNVVLFTFIAHLCNGLIQRLFFSITTNSIWLRIIDENLQYQFLLYIVATIIVVVVVNHCFRKFGVRVKS